MGGQDLGQGMGDGMGTGNGRNEGQGMVDGTEGQGDGAPGWGMGRWGTICSLLSAAWLPWLLCLQRFLLLGRV